MSIWKLLEKGGHFFPLHTPYNKTPKAWGCRSFLWGLCPASRRLDHEAGLGTQR